MPLVVPRPARQPCLGRAKDGGLVTKRRALGTIDDPVVDGRLPRALLSGTGGLVTSEMLGGRAHVERGYPNVATMQRSRPPKSRRTAVASPAAPTIAVTAAAWPAPISIRATPPGASSAGSDGTSAR